MQIKKAIILSAGYGKRLNPMTLSKPKPLLKINKKTLLENTIHILEKFGIEEIIINTHYLSDQISTFINNKKFSSKIFIIEEHENILDTGGGVLNAAKKFNNYPFFELIEKGHVYLAQPPLYKISKGTKSFYVKNDKELENFFVKSSENFKKIKKGSQKYQTLIEEEKLKINIQRFKGLGEMNPEELWSTTLNPETRTLLKVQYSKQTKIKSKDDQKLIQTLMGNDVAPRKDFIISRALDVSNLDI